MEHVLTRECESHKLPEEGIDQLPTLGQPQSPEREHRKKRSLKLSIRFQPNLNFQVNSQTIFWEAIFTTYVFGKEFMLGIYKE